MAQVIALKRGDTIRREVEDSRTDFQVFENNEMAPSIVALILPLIAPPIILFADGLRANDGTIKGGFPITITYENLLLGIWHVA
jgi:hypothetical protein